MEPTDALVQGVIQRDGTFNVDNNEAYLKIIYPDYLKGKSIKLINRNRYYRLFPGDVIAFEGFISKFNNHIEKYYENIGIYGKITIQKDTYVKILRCGNPLFLNRLLLPFDIYRKQVFSLLPGEYYNMLMSFIFGERNKLSRGTLNMFQNSGIYHLLALSGLHMAVIMGILFLLARIMRLKKEPAIIVVLAIITMYLVFINFRVSAIRASIMLSIVMLSYMIKRYVSLYNLLFAVAFILLVLSPRQLYTPGFLLSFSATLAIIISRDILILPMNNSFQKNIIYPFIISVMISLFTLPILFYFFGNISLITPFANIIFIPMTTFVITLGIVALFLYIFSPVFAGYIVSVIYFTEKVYFYMLSYFNRISFRLTVNKEVAIILLVIPISIILFMILKNRKTEDDILAGI